MKISEDTKKFAEELVYEMIKQKVIENEDDLNPEIVGRIIDAIKLDAKQD